MKLMIDPDFKNLLPELTTEEYTNLEKDIVKHGILSPIIVWNGVIVDGHNRYSIAQAHRISDIPSKTISFASRADAMQWIIGSQLARRNLTKSQLVAAYAKYEAERAKEAEARPGGRPKKTAEKLTSNLMQVSEEKHRNPTVAAEVAKKIGVSENTYRDMKLIKEYGTNDQIARMDKGGRGNGVSRIANEIRGILKPNGEAGQNNKKFGQEMKCHECGEILPTNQFEYAHGGYRSVCKKCRNMQRAKQKAEQSEKNRLEGTNGFYVDSVEEKVWTVQSVIDQLERDFNDYLEGLKIELNVHMAEVKSNDMAIDAAIDGFVEQLTQMKGVYK